MAAALVSFSTQTWRRT